MKKQQKTYKNIISFILSIMILIANLNLSLAVSDTVYIDSVSDLINFSKDASLDTYFKDRTIILNSDIDLSSVESFSIPTFSGTFDGQGHTISGISLSKSGSTQGLFRYLQEDGIIKNLNVVGNITPSGSQSIVGGLVGNNKGNIKNCNFKGIVKGKNNIGGLVGINEATGTISNCNSQGNVNGEHFTGGIAGQNLGTILKSTNLSEVNTSITEPTLNIEDINWSQINSMENIKAHTDTGGIAGLSTGFIQDCVNHGSIGYKYMGYNVGGIVGRQSGYLHNCQNYNTILGRKDVGGIVGQIEPHLILLFSEDTLQKLDQELDVLQNLLNKSFTNARSSSLSISSELNNVVKSVDDTKDIMQTLSRGTVDYIDDVTDTVNITSKRIRYTLEEISLILEDAEKLSIALNDGLNHIESGFNNLEITSDKMSSALNESKYAMSNLRQAISLGEDAISKTRNALGKLANNLDDKEIDSILSISENNLELQQSLKKLAESFALGSDAIASIIEILEDYGIDFDIDLDINKEILLDNLEKIFDNLSSISSNLFKLNKVILTIINSNSLDNIFRDLEDSFYNLNLSIKSISDSISQLESTSRQSKKAFRDFRLGFDKFGDSSETMTTIIISIRDLLDSLTSEPNIELPNISSEYRESGENLFDTLDNISSGINKINKEIKDGSNALINDFQAAGDQIFNIFNLLIQTSEDRGSSKYIEDNSDKNMDDSSLGTVYKNQNYGTINGSVNIGGITGSIAIEYDLDPEDDIFKKGTPSLNFKYLTTAILKNCINHGKVTAKKDYTGGIAGRMDLGIITMCENYGDIESKEGDYVGGIAGASYRTIDKSFVFASLSGKDYVGGIAGYGNNLFDSYSLIDIKNGNEYIGTIAGDTEGEVANNHYVHDTIAAIDGISYSEKASPISYKELSMVDTLPKAFTEFHLTFIADDEIVDKIPFQYGDSFDLESLPSIPMKDGYDSSWEDFNSNSMVFNTTVEAVYTPLSTVLSSNILRNEDTSPLFLAEGKFYTNTKLKVSPFNIDNTEFPMESNIILEAWSVELQDIEDDQKEENYTLRLLLPKTKKHVTIWQSKNNHWEEINSSTNGSYIVFSMNGTSGTFAIVENNSPWIILIIIGASLLLLIFFIKKINNK